MISYALWQSQFGGRADIVGQTVPGPGTAVPIVGVTPPEFFGVEVGPAIRRRDAELRVGQHAPRSLVARDDRPAEAGLDARAGAVAPAGHPAGGAARRHAGLPRRLGSALSRRWRVNVVDASAGVSPLRRSYQRPLWILMAVAALVLLIASVNLANLLLARATARRQEFAVRLAIGGTRGARAAAGADREPAARRRSDRSPRVGVALAVSRSIPPLMSTGRRSHPSRSVARLARVRLHGARRRR